jgi:hypothetical protein
MHIRVCADACERDDMSDLASASIAFLAGAGAAAVCLSLTEPSLVREARSAERDGRTINNEIMQSVYPEAYREGNPEYLERDFEAGADLICDQIRLQHRRDICAEQSIRWR